MTDTQEAFNVWPRCEAQWKGTATCLDAVCGHCGKYSHYCINMPWTGQIECPHCNDVAIVRHHLVAVSIEGRIARQSPVRGTND